ncbi:50S ribosomal protein L9 [Desulfovibrio sp. OttesenSCG-928-C06]|nr:50S ribosomal protein L9 [Desulfovibrio sp. OttesenSCG-928-C06]
MKLILRADVENLGRLGDVVKVRPGYGRNYLLPQGLAMLATDSNLKVFEQERRKLQAKMDALRSDANAVADRIAAVALSITMRVGENDKLYGSVTTSMIAAELAKQGIEVDRHRILLDAAIRTLGEFDVRIRLHADVNATLKLKVVPEERYHEEDVAAEPVAEAVSEQEAEQPAE